MLRHGYQSWSPTAVATFRVDQDPTPCRGRAVAADRHAPRRLGAGRGRRAAQRAGDGAARRHRRGARRRVPRRLGARRHVPRAPRPRRLRRRRALDRGVPRRRRAPAGRAARAAPGVARRRRGRSVAAARGVGGRARARPARARTTAPYQVGWCSWYHYFHGVTEADLRANLRRGRRLALRRVPARRRLPGRHRRLARPPTRSSRRRSTRWPRPSRAEGRTPGHLDRARSSPAPDSARRRRAPRVARHPPASRARRSSAWSTTRGAAPVHTLDTTQPEVLDHLESRRPLARRRRLPLPEARLHLRAVDPRRLRRPDPHAGPAGAGRLRGHPARRRRRRVPPRLRRAARARGRRRRRHAHRRRRGARGGTRSPTSTGRPGTRAASRPR